MIKVLIVDDEPLVVAGVRSMVNNLNTDFTVCATASNGTAALELIEKERDVYKRQVISLDGYAILCRSNRS